MPAATGTFPDATIGAAGNFKDRTEMDPFLSSKGSPADYQGAKEERQSVVTPESLQAMFTHIPNRTNATVAGGEFAPRRTYEDHRNTLSIEQQAKGCCDRPKLVSTPIASAVLPDYTNSPVGGFTHLPVTKARA